MKCKPTGDELVFMLLLPAPFAQQRAQDERLAYSWRGDRVFLMAYRLWSKKRNFVFSGALFPVFF